MKALNNGTAAIFHFVFSILRSLYLKNTAIQFSYHRRPTKKIEGFMLQRKDWVTYLNRFRTDVGVCGKMENN